MVDLTRGDRHTNDMSKRNREEYNAYMRDYMLRRYHQRREAALIQLGARCVRCGSTEKLEMLREINILGMHIELGAWRYAAFGLLLMFTLRFAQNGLLYPIIDRLFLQRAREETVAKRVQAAEVES